jgi:hypothetical protein
MKKIILLALSLCTSPFLFAQLGVSGSHTWFNAGDWESYTSKRISPYDDAYFFQTGFQVGVDYWFRLPDVRVEFQPEVRYGRFTASPVSFNDEGNLTWQSFSFHLTTNIYPFDIFGDCDCPTFSKQDPLFKKGFFFQISPGVNYLAQSYQSERVLSLHSSQNDWAASLGLGAGLDIGISDWITITPYGRITGLFWANSAGYEDLPFFGKGVYYEFPQPLAIWLPEAGLRLGIRWKH